jgi:hypothetical protein
MAAATLPIAAWAAWRDGTLYQWPAKADEQVPIDVENACKSRSGGVRISMPRERQFGQVSNDYKS